MALTVRRLGFDPTTLRVVWTLVAAGLLYTVRHVVLLLVVGILAAYVLLPVVNLLDRYIKGGRRRPLALAVVYLLVVAILILLGATVGVYAAHEAAALAAKVHEVVSSGRAVDLPLPEFLKPFAAQAVPEVGMFLRDHAQEIFQTLSQWTLRMLAGLRDFVELGVVLILSFFFLKDGDGIVRSFVVALPHGARERARAILVDVHHALALYVRAMVLLAMLTATVYSAGLSMMGVPYALLLGVVAFPFEFIPMLGPVVSGLAVMLVALFSGYTGLGWILVFLVVWRIVQDYGVLPLVMGGELELSPLAMVAGVLAGQAIGGIAGALLAVPTLAVARIVIQHLVLDDGAPATADHIPPSASA